jgi:AraC-like DNA-binding protein
MTDLQPYLQSDCNLAYFAKLVKIPAHHLAYYFREERKQTFNDYRNEWRVNHTKKLITEGKHAELTLEAIGQLSGFSSRNAFFTAFKKVEDISPGAFAAQFIK